MNSKSILVGTSLMFGRSVLILGSRGSGTYQCAWEALKFVDPVGTITVSMAEMNYLASISAEEGQIAPESRTMIHLDNLIKSNLDKIICVHGLESIKPHWLMYFLHRWTEGNKILFVGEECNFSPLMDRIEVVRM